ncbi:MAG: sulfatase-like hydrolase/transferase [Aggregatilineales bacterium]
MPSQPDILFIVLDTLRRDHLSSYGYHQETSPVLDEFSLDATRFDRAISPAQWTIPAHGSLFTGQYPGKHGLTQAYHQLSGTYPTLAELLQVADYHTVAFCNNPMLGILETGLRRGFEEFFNYTGATPHRPVDLQRSALRRRVDTQSRKVARYLTNRFAHSDFLFRMSMFPLFVPFWSKAMNFKGNTPRSIDDMIDYREQYYADGADKPLFMFANLMGAHMPYHPPDNYLPAELRRDKQAMRFMNHHNLDATGWLSPTDDPLEDWQQHTLHSFYDAEIRHQDEQLGRLLNHVKASGKLDNTIVVIAADHGEGHGDHQFMGHSFVVYQELVHVPLFIRYPERFPSGKTIQKNVSTRRVFHTILDVADIPAPPVADGEHSIADLSLIRSLNGKPDTEGNSAFAEAFPPDNLLSVLRHKDPTMIERMNLTSVRRGVYQDNHKLAMVGQQVEGMYDIASDPAELTNIAASHDDVVETLQGKVHDFVREHSGTSTSRQNEKLSDEVMENLRALGYID